MENKQVTIKEKGLIKFFLLCFFILGFSIFIIGKLSFELTKISFIILLIISVVISAIITIFFKKTSVFKIDDNGNLVVIEESAQKSKTSLYEKNLINDFYFKEFLLGKYLFITYKNIPFSLAHESNEEDFLNLVSLLCMNFPELTKKIESKKVFDYMKTGKIKTGCFDKILLFFLFLVIIIIISAFIFGIIHSGI